MTIRRGCVDVRIPSACAGVNLPKPRQTADGLFYVFIIKHDVGFSNGWMDGLFQESSPAFAWARNHGQKNLKCLEN